MTEKTFKIYSKTRHCLEKKLDNPKYSEMHLMAIFDTLTLYMHEDDAIEWLKTAFEVAREIEEDNKEIDENDNEAEA